MFNFIKKKVISHRLQDELLYEYVMDEMEEGIKIKGLWAKAIAYSDGDSNKATSKYMQYRVQSIKDYFEVLKISYEEMSKKEIYSVVQENNKETLSSEEYNFLKTHECNEKSINVEIRENVIEIKKNKICYCYDRNKKKSYIMEQQTKEEDSTSKGNNNFNESFNKTKEEYLKDYQNRKSKRKEEEVNFNINEIIEKDGYSFLSKNIVRKNGTWNDYTVTYSENEVCINDNDIIIKKYYNKIN